jgi:hypothetical protein
VRTVICAALAVSCVLLAADAPPSAQQKPPRLLVLNQTTSTVEVFIRLKDTWHSRGRVSPKASLPVFNVSNGQRVRAVWGSRSVERDVKLVFDREYGGWQDRMIVSDAAGRPPAKGQPTSY